MGVFLGTSQDTLSETNSELGPPEKMANPKRKPDCLPCSSIFKNVFFVSFREGKFKLSKLFRQKMWLESPNPQWVRNDFLPLQNLHPLRHVSNEKKPCCLGYTGDEILPKYIGIIS